MLVSTKQPTVGVVTGVSVYVIGVNVTTFVVVCCVVPRTIPESPEIQKKNLVNMLLWLK